MKRLLTIELQKIWKNRASRVLTLAYFILLTFIALIASIKFDLGPFKFHLAEMGIFNFPYIWHFNTYIASILKFFLAIVIVSMMANEYSYGTLKQNLIDGMSKKEFIQSKFLTVFLFATVSTVFLFILTLILGFSFSSFTEIDIVFCRFRLSIGLFCKTNWLFLFLFISWNFDQEICICFRFLVGLEYYRRNYKWYFNIQSFSRGYYCSQYYPVFTTTIHV